MLVIQWLALSGAAFALTLVWLVVLPDERVMTTGGLSAIAWATSALTARGLQTVTQTGQRVAAGSTVLAFLALAFCAVSILATIGYRTGHYPPQPADEPPVPIDE